MAANYPYLFEPGRIGRVELKNRLVMAPMGIGALVGFDGLFSERAIDYYEARAEGGTGLITTTVCLATNKFETWEVDGLKYLPTFDNLIKVKNFKQLTERIHDHGCKIFAQLTAGFGRVYRPTVAKMTGHKAFAPSETPLFWAPDQTAREMTVEEIEGLSEAIGKAAFIAREGGFDGVELHGHEGYLLDQFKTALWNRRTDRYGGDLMGRMQFPLSVIKNVQKAAGDDFPISYRYGLEHKLEGGRTREEGLEIAKILREAGVAVLHVDAGCYETWHWPHPPEYQPPGCMVDMAEQVKRHVEIPVITVGRMGYPELANQVIEDGRADFVAMGRPLLADPQFANKARKGQTEDIRPCIGCNECFRRLYLMTYLSCAVNPSCGNERRLEIGKTESPKKVMVIGGGVAGLEAARVCALRGHRVRLYEKTGRLGGILPSVGRHSLKNDLQRLVDYQVRQVKKSGVNIKMASEVNIEIVKNEKPDVVFLATGSIPLRNIVGREIEENRTFSAIDVLEGNAEIGSSVVVIGGGSAGCEVAYELAVQKRAVTLCEQLPELATDLHGANRGMLLELLSTKGVNVKTDCKVENIVPGTVICQLSDGTKEELKADSIVLAIGGQSVNGLLPALNQWVDEVHAVGDCVAPRKVIDAIWEAHKRAIKT
jgi:2-enoate reductase